MCFRKHLVLILSASFMTGCASTPKTVVVEDSDPAIQSLLTVAKEIAAYERRLYTIESSRYLDNNTERLGDWDMYFLPALNEYQTLGDTFTGPLESIIEEITAIAGLEQVRYIGNKPSNPIIVNVDTSSRKLIDMLADAGYEAAQRAHVELKVKERLIQVEYAPH